MIGFTGSRNLDISHRALVNGLVGSLVKANQDICVGCARGLDAMVRYAAPHAEIFSVASGEWGKGKGKGAFAARSQAMVKAVARSDRAGIVGVASSACPDGIVPAPGWSSGNPPSGTWSTIALSIGLNIKTVVFIVDDGALPQWSGGSWVKAGSGVWADGWRWEVGAKQMMLF